MFPMTKSESVSARRMQPTNLAPLPIGVEKRLRAYAMAAGAGGVGLLALALPAEAEVVYTPAHLKLLPNSAISIDLNNDGTTDITLRNEINSLTSSQSCELFVDAGAAAGAGYRALALSAGASIGSRHGFSRGFMAFAFRGVGGTIITGDSWANVSNRYLGVRFQINGETHYGWARLSVQIGKAGTIFAALTGYAYETIANRPLRAGQRTGTDFDAKTSGAGSLGALALGSARWPPPSTGVPQFTH